MSVRMLRLLMVAAALAVAGSFAREAEDDRPVWDANPHCVIPNEPPTSKGVCRAPKDCPAFQQINSGPEFTSVGRLSFIRALYCDDEEIRICCPEGQNGYRSPQLDTAGLPRKVRNDSSSSSDGFQLGTRFGEDECGYQATVNKVKGTITEIDEFPWAALLFYRNNYHGCGGVLISRNFVLTAAHCLVGSNYDKYGPLAFVRLREYNIYSDPDCMVVGGEMDCAEQKLDVAPRSVKIHPQYVPDSFQQQHDIGLIEISNPEPYSDFMQSICLPEPGMEFQNGMKMFVCGWGRTNFFEEDNASPVKMKANVPYVEQRQCGDAYRSQAVSLGPGQICAGGKKDRDSCAGDSGSPLMFYNRRSGSWVLTGIVSRGPAVCGKVDRPGIYTNVKAYLPWIKKTARL